MPLTEKQRQHQKAYRERKKHDPEHQAKVKARQRANGAKYQKVYRDKNKNDPTFREKVRQQSNKWYIGVAGDSYRDRARKEQALRNEYGVQGSSKKCRGCNQDKDIVEFWLVKKYYDGFDYKCKSCRSNEYNNTYISKMFSRAKKRAKETNVPFTITKEDISVPDVCPVLGIPLEFGGGTGVENRANSPSLDRIIPELGYVPGNIAVISYRANLLKSNGTLEEHKMLVEWLTRTLG